MDDLFFMREALKEARKGLGLTAPNPAVGAIVVKDGQIVGRGYHPKAGQAHAEPRALVDAGDEARGATIYVTLEPCSTTGRTPPCTEAIKKAGISRVVMGCLDPNPAHAGAAIPILESAGIAVTVGVAEDECRALIRGFVHVQITKRPYLSLKLATSMDGRIADAQGNSRWISGPESRERVMALRREVDAVLVGTETARLDDPRLMPRPAEGRTPWRIVPDRKARLSLDLHLFSDEHRGRTICLLGEGHPERAAALQKQGVEVMAVSDFAWGKVFEMLATRGINHILCEGGGGLAAALLREELINEAWFVQGPRILGASGRPAFGEEFDMESAPVWVLHDLERVGADIWQRYTPNEERF